MTMLGGFAQLMMAALSLVITLVLIRYVLTVKLGDVQTRPLLTLTGVHLVINLLLVAMATWNS